MGIAQCCDRSPTTNVAWVWFRRGVIYRLIEDMGDHSSYIHNLAAVKKA